ncbi:hypothetical protein [Pseudomonas sp. zfem002]|uniref:hypothetical protein n=1 Tax=Pseudomonas sp. zfem002 TaxID=3078197 RepID=UPI002928E1F3|nr:hypothetical protein [Pseudomonas sp. zfem002]MDU9393971.1 hypothetical protein [Pseudomonas sp. zfem002]
MRTGCLIARETGEFCGGSFTKEGGWDNPTYPDFDLEAQSPRAWDYAKGRSVPHGGTLASLENLLLCDPPDRENLDAYKAISEKNIFGADAETLDSLRTILEKLGGS